jgi:hypothetical protein
MEGQCIERNEIWGFGDVCRCIRLAGGYGIGSCVFRKLFRPLYEGSLFLLIPGLDLCICSPCGF